MKKILVAIVVALLLASLVTPPMAIRAQARRRTSRGRANRPRAARRTPAPAEVALLTQPDGNVQLKRGGHTQTVSEDMLLVVGDAIKVNGNGTAVVYQAYLPVKRLMTNDQFEVKLHSPPPPPPARALSPEEFASFKAHYLSAKNTRKDPSPTTQGNADGSGLTLIEPRNSAALSGRPTFFWSRVTDATKYVVNVYDKKESILCTESTAETRLVLPNKCKPLAEGDYKWDVTAQTGEQVSDNPGIYDATSFTVVNEAHAAKIRAAIEHSRMVAADGGADAQAVYISILMENNLYPLAAAETLRVLAKSPNDQALWALLMDSYAKMQRWRSREVVRTLSTSHPSIDAIQAFTNRSSDFIKPMS